MALDASPAAAAVDYDHGRSAIDPSAALAEKLLQGWALLQEHCPQCLTPLVRNRQRRMYCVACDQWVVQQAEAAAQAPSDTLEDQAISGTRIPPPEPVSTDAIADHGRVEQKFDDRAEILEVSLPSNRRQVPEVGHCPEALQHALSKISDILVQKLEELGLVLSSSHDVSSIQTAAGAIRECVQTICAVKQMLI